MEAMNVLEITISNMVIISMNIIVRRMMSLFAMKVVLRKIVQMKI